MSHDRGGRRLTLLLSLVALLAGAAVITMTVVNQRNEPPPARSAGSVEPTRDTSLPKAAESDGAGDAGKKTTSGPEPQGEKPLGLSRPELLEIPSLDIKTSVNTLGRAGDGSLAVPQPGPKLDEAAWFDGSPSPGQPGPSIIEGHVETEQGKSVFFELGDIQPGDKVFVNRKDGSELTFTVSGVRDFEKDRFPTDLVFGGRDNATPQLRLITCSDFNESTGHHEGNAVVFTELTNVKKAS